MKHRDIFIRIFKKYALYNPVPVADQERILQSQKRVLQAIARQRSDIPINVQGVSTVLDNKIKKKIRIGKISFSPVPLAGMAAALIVLIGAGVLVMKWGHRGGDTGGMVLFAIGDVAIQKNGAAPRPLTVKDSVAAGDIVRTGADAEAVLQIRDTGIVRVLPGSEIVVSELLDDAHTSGILLSRGSIFSKIIRKKSLHFWVETPTLTASVRGTEFLTSCSNDSSTVDLSNGSVVITKKSEPDLKTPLEEGNRAHLDQHLKLVVSPLDVSQRYALDKHALYDYIENAEAMSGKELSLHFKEIQEKEESMDARLKQLGATEKTLSPLDRLRVQGKPISMIHLKDQTKIAGYVISQSGDYVVVDTGDGIIRISKEDIVRQFPYQ